MDVLVDTSVWSLALRRRTADLSDEQQAIAGELSELVQAGRVAMVGPVRQELLSGIADHAAFEALKNRLVAFEDLELVTADFEEAAAVNNRCRAAGVAGSAVDFFLCAVALRRELSVFTTDRDFDRYASVVPLQLHRV